MFPDQQDGNEHLAEICRNRQTTVDRKNGYGGWAPSLSLQSSIPTTMSELDDLWMSNSHKMEAPTASLEAYINLALVVVSMRCELRLNKLVIWIFIPLVQRIWGCHHTILSARFEVRRKPPTV